MNSFAEKIMLSEAQINILLSKMDGIKDICKKHIKEGLKVETKKDGSKVTNLDKFLDMHITNIIRNDLKNTDIIISEEDIADGNTYSVSKDDSFWSIDPIDSTKSLIENNPYYCVNIAYIVNNIPVFGIIYAPEFDTLWYGIHQQGSFKIVKGNKTSIKCRDIPKQNAIMISSEEQKTPSEFIEKHHISEDIKLPSAIKFTYIAEGKADYYIRKRNKACDWDIASGHAIIIAAGGDVMFTDSSENFQYGLAPYFAPSLLMRGHNA